MGVRGQFTKKRFWTTLHSFSSQDDFAGDGYADCADGGGIL